MRGRDRGRLSKALASLAALLIAALVVAAASSERLPIPPSHGRPFLLPPRERARILGLVRTEAWARAELERVRAAAQKGDGYWSAFLYALEGDARYLAAARRWLLQYGHAGGDLGRRALEAGPEFFRGGQPWLGDVYYRLDIAALVAYDWVHTGLTPDERQTIEAGIRTSARFRMRAMDRWTQTANLVFKPTVMVATAGLVTGDPELLAWGFHRHPGSVRGGYFPVLETMLRDGGPWAEAPIYPIAHKSLLLMLATSRRLHLLDGRDWFSRRSPSGGSPKGLLEYYLDTAYPAERTGYGAGQIRVAAYGDGATSAEGDLFLVNPAGPGLHLHEELAEAFAVSGDPRYAAFLAMVPGYAPNLVDRRPLLPDVRLPAAPSRIWPGYGLAMLRSDESPAYWTSGKALAIFQVMSQGYGHDHRDKFGIMLHGAGRLLYPDYNAVQYENPAIGWTRNTVAHNTLVVDEGETRNATPTGVRHEFTPAVKFLATSASGVYEGVAQTRVLLLTPEYLLDLFHATSPVPHTYDYVLHALGAPRPDDPGRFHPSDALAARYTLLEGTRATTTGGQWALEFVQDARAVRDKEAHDRRWLEERKKTVAPARHGPEWYAHTAAVRVTMAAAPDTLVAHGTDVHQIGMLVARRAGHRDTLFAATHEPFANAEPPGITGVTVLARSRDAVVVRVDARDYTDYAAASVGPQTGLPEHALAPAGDPGMRFAFRNYGYVRVAREGRIAAWGGWTGLRLPAATGSVTLNGQPVPARLADGHLTVGRLPAALDPPLATPRESPLVSEVSPAVARVFERDRRALVLRITNGLDRPVTGWIEFEPTGGLRVEPSRPTFGPVPPGKAAEVALTVVAADARPGRHTVTYRVHHAGPGSGPTLASAPRALPVTVGPVLEPVYRHPAPAVYRIHAPRFTAECEMFAGLCRSLAADDGTVRLDGPLFTFSDGQQELLSPATRHAFTWPTEVPAHLVAHTYDVARYHLLFQGDRILVGMNPDWTRAPKVHFTIPGHWRSPERPPHWAEIVTAKQTGGDPRVAAAELAFPGAPWHLCFEFLPPQPVTLAGTGLQFTLDPLARDRWTVGFCQPGDLDTWRWKRW